MSRELHNCRPDPHFLAIPGCADFIAAILQKAEKPDNPIRPGGVLSTLEKIIEQKGIVVDGSMTGGRALGTIDNGTGGIRIQPQNFDPALGTDYVRTEQLNRAYFVLSEGIHHSGSKRSFNDQEMS